MASGNLESLKKQCTFSCFERIKIEIDEAEKNDTMIVNPVIKELAIIEVQPGKQNRPDMFSALIKGFFKNGKSYEFKTECIFLRQGDWWVLHEIKT